MNPATATFLTMDPVRGVVGERSVRWNPYLYVGGNPINYTDPTGEFFGIALAAGWAAKVLAAVGGGGLVKAALAAGAVGAGVVLVYDMYRNTRKAAEDLWQQCDELSRDLQRRLREPLFPRDVDELLLDLVPGMRFIRSVTNTASNLVSRTGVQTRESRVRPDDRDNDRITLYHYTRAQNIDLIISSGESGGLRPSLGENGDAQWGDGQYFTDLTPSESSTVTRYQHSYALFNIPWNWRGNPPLDDIAWMEFSVPRQSVQQVAPLFGPRFPHRSIYLLPNTGVLPIGGLYIRSGIVNFQLSRSGNQ